MPRRKAPAPPAPGSPAALCARALALRHREAQAACDLARLALETDTDPAGQRRARAVLGACLSDLPDSLQQGRELLHALLSECEAAGDDAARCQALLELGSNYLSTFQHETALGYLQPAVELARELGRRADEARALRFLGAVHSATGQFDLALSLLLEALELHEALRGEGAGSGDDAERWERGKLFGRIAVVYSNLDQSEQALDYYRVAQEAFGERFPLSAARTWYRMGIAAEGVGDLARAERFYRECLERYQALGNDAGRGLGLMGTAKMLLARGGVDEAEAAIEEASALLEADATSQGYFADALWALGDVRMARGRPDDALAAYQQALPLYERFERPAAHRAALYARISAAYVARGDFARALEHHRLFHARQVEHLEARMHARLAAMMAQFDTERALQEREIHRLRNIELEREIAERREAEAALAAAQEELERSNRELHALTIRDPLTGAFNRRYLDQRLAEAMPLAVRGVTPLSLMMCDIDDFKLINDTFSHAVGDQVLCALASTLREQVRQSDVVARFGGEEFVILFPSTTLERAAAAAEKLVARVRAYPWNALRPGLAVTISAGVATATGHSSHEKLLREVDARMYQAKRGGKDRVVR